MATPEQTPAPERKIVEWHKLSRASYDELEKKCAAPYVTAATTAHQAGFMLGIAAVLTLLRDGYRAG